MIPRAEEAIVKALSVDVPAHERMDVVEELGHANGHLRKHFVENVLVRVLKEDPNPIVRHEAAFSLGSLHGRGRQLRAASIDALCEAAHHESSIVVRHEAAEALGWIPDPKVHNTLELIARDSSADVVETARISLGRHELVDPEI